MSKLIALAAVAASTLGVAAPGWAHVTLQPNEVPADGFTRLNVRVPNERDEAATTKVRVKFPPGFLSISYEPVEGWSIAVKKRKLDKPAEQFGEQVTEEVDVVEITADPGVGIEPGQFRDFGLSLKMPNRPGAALSFKALQTYDSGEVVRWIGPPDADEPAPRVTLAAVAEEPGHAAAGAEKEPAAAEEDDDGDDDDDGPSTALVIAALVLGALGLAAGLAGLTAARRSRQG
jgi:uncharacterized protein